MKTGPALRNQHFKKHYSYYAIIFIVSDFAVICNRKYHIIFREMQFVFQHSDKVPALRRKGNGGSKRKTGRRRNPFCGGLLIYLSAR